MKIEHAYHNGYDWVRHVNYLKHYQYPTAISSEDVAEAFKDELRDIIPLKLEEALGRCHELKIQRDKKLAVIEQKTKQKLFDRWFWSSFIFHEFSEYFVIQKWIGYWLRLWYKVNNQPLSKILHTSFNGIDDLVIERARERRIEEFYEGSLRRSGSRLVGLCPLHEEKTPSFFIFPDNHYHCYGCQAHGDVISFVQKTKNLSFAEIVRYLL